MRPKVIGTRSKTAFWAPTSKRPTDRPGPDPRLFRDIHLASDVESREPRQPPHLPAVPLGGGVVGAGVASVLDRLRKVQQRHRPGGMFIRLPDRRHRLFEQRLRVGDGREIVVAADGALRVLAEECLRSGVVVPSITGITVGSESVELLVDSEGTVADRMWLDGLPNALKVGPSSSVIVIDRRALPVPSPGTVDTAASSVAPLLITAGHRSDGLVLVNLESLGTIAVTGIPVDCEGVLRAWPSSWPHHSGRDDST